MFRAWVLAVVVALVSGTALVVVTARLTLALIERVGIWPVAGAALVGVIVALLLLVGIIGDTMARRRNISV